MGEWVGWVRRFGSWQRWFFVLWTRGGGGGGGGRLKGEAASFGGCFVLELIGGRRVSLVGTKNRPSPRLEKRRRVAQSTQGGQFKKAHSMEQERLAVRFQEGPPKHQPTRSSLFVAPLPTLLTSHRWLSVFSFCAVAAVVGLVVIGGPIYANEERETPGHDPDLDASVVWWNWPGSVAKLGSIVFALSCAPAVLHGYTSMTPRSTRWGLPPRWLGCLLSCSFPRLPRIVRCFLLLLLLVFISFASSRPRSLLSSVCIFPSVPFSPLL